LQNKKFEARNPSFETNSNDQNTNNPDCHCERSEGRYDPRRYAPRNDNPLNLNMEFVSDFDIRISDLRGGDA
jgi:hypothetical protein